MSPQPDSNRRSFLAGSTAMGAMGLGAAIGMPAALADNDKHEELRVGVMNLQLYSHMGMWAPLLKPFTGMRITHWPSGKGARLPIWRGGFDSRRALFQLGR